MNQILDEELEVVRSKFPYGTTFILHGDFKTFYRSNGGCARDERFPEVINIPTEEGFFNSAFCTPAIDFSTGCEPECDGSCEQELTALRLWKEKARPFLKEYLDDNYKYYNQTAKEFRHKELTELLGGEE